MQRPFTHEELERARFLHALCGLTWSQIGQRLGRSGLALRSRMHRYNRGHGASYAKKLQDYHAAIERGIDEGLSYRQIGERLGKTETAVRLCASRLGLGRMHSQREH